MAMLQMRREDAACTIRRWGVARLLLLVLATWCLPTVGLSQLAKPVANNEQIIQGTPPPKFEWSSGDRALREVMDADPNYADPARPGTTRDGAIKSWQRFLERSDITAEQQAFAWWRLGALYGYNLDPSSGDKADYKLAENAISKTREILKDIVSSESLNSASLYGTLPGKPVERAQRLGEAFNWLMTRSDEDLDRSANRINLSGNIIDAKFFPNIAGRESPVEKRRQFLAQQLRQYQAFISDRITQEIKSSQSAEAIDVLLKAIKDAASKQQLGKKRCQDRMAVPLSLRLCG